MASSFLSSAAKYGDVSAMNPTSQVLQYQMDKIKWTQMGQAAGRAEANAQAQAIGLNGMQPQMGWGYNNPYGAWAMTGSLFSMMSYILVPLSFAATIGVFFSKMGIAAAALAASMFFIFVLHSLLNTGYGVMLPGRTLAFSIMGGFACGAIIGGGGYAVLMDGVGGEQQMVFVGAGAIAVFLVIAGMMYANSFPPRAAPTMQQTTPPVVR